MGVDCIAPACLAVEAPRSLRGFPLSLRRIYSVHSEPFGAGSVLSYFRTFVLSYSRTHALTHFPPMHLRADQKLFLTYLTVIAAVVAALTLGVGTLLRRHMTEMQAGDLRRELLLARSLYESHTSAHPDSVADWLGSVADRRVTLIAPDGRVIGDSEVPDAELAGLENHGGRPEVRVALRGGLGR